MNKWICNTAIILGVVFLSAQTPRESHAGPLLDWLSGRTPYYQPQPWHVDRRYPRTLPQPSQLIYAGQPAGSYAAGVAYQQPIPSATVLQNTQANTAPVLQQTPAFQTPALQATPADQSTVIPQYAPNPNLQGGQPYSGCGIFGGNCSWFAPRTGYRSTWVRVPVTRYRPVTVGTAYGVPATQPCNGYAWRLRRVPVTTYRPFAGLWDQLFGPRPAVSYFGSQVGTAPCATYGTVIPQTVPSASPYYPAQPNSGSGSTSVVPSAGLGSPAGTGGVPADRQPSLNPNGIQTNDPSTMSPARPNSAPVATFRQPSLRNDSPGFGAAPQAPAIKAPAGSARQTPDDPAIGSDRMPALTKTPPTLPQRNLFNVNPIRDPEAKSDRRTVDDIPQLLGPSNHSAANDADRGVQAWQVVPIKWETRPGKQAVPATAAQRPSATLPTVTRPARQEWDDSGWQSAR